MPVGVTVEIPGMTADIYQQVMANMNWGQDDDPQGFIAHYACEKPDGLFVFDVWESAEDWQRSPRASSAPRSPPQPAAATAAARAAVLPAASGRSIASRASAHSRLTTCPSSSGGSARSTSRRGGATPIEEAIEKRWAGIEGRGRPGSSRSSSTAGRSG